MCADKSDPKIAPKLEWLVLSDLDILFDSEEKLLSVLKQRRDCNIGVKTLVVRSCRVHKEECRSKLGKLVKKVKWEKMKVMGSDYEGSDSVVDEYGYFG